jgi:hypothetical protein
MQMSEPDKVQRTYEGKEAGASGEFVRSFYIRRILHPLFMFQQFRGPSTRPLRRIIKRLAHFRTLPGCNPRSTP